MKILKESRGLVFVLILLMIIIPFQETVLLAQPAPPPTPQAEPLPPEELDRLVAPIALYPDALVAQILTASTYPDQVAEANRWRQLLGNASPEQIADGANAQNWDPSVKALTAFPSVLERMDRNIQWTTDLGNAYYNQPLLVVLHVREADATAEWPARVAVDADSTEGRGKLARSVANSAPKLLRIPDRDQQCPGDQGMQ